MALYPSGLLDSTSFSLPQWPGIAAFPLSENHLASGFNIRNNYNTILGAGASFDLTAYPDLPKDSGIEYLAFSLKKGLAHSIQAENSGVLAISKYNILFPGQDLGSGVRY